MSFPRNERDQWGGMGSNQPDGQQMMPLQPEMGSPALPQQMSNVELEASRVRVEFVAEQSRVIFLSSLPRDIYQDDIFDFFASRGTRPELLWTLMPRNGTGTDVAYAVFATHQQASRSLALDWHLLPATNTRVRVTPCSNRVLNGSLVLTPYPIRIDWWCHICSHRNHARRNNCEMCGNPKHIAQHPSAGGGNGRGQGHGRGDTHGGGGGFTGDNTFGGGLGGNNAFGRGTGNGPATSGGYGGAQGAF